jgi:hypothetical protein
MGCVDFTWGKGHWVVFVVRFRKQLIPRFGDFNEEDTILVEQYIFYRNFN